MGRSRRATARSLAKRAAAATPSRSEGRARTPTARATGRRRQPAAGAHRDVRRRRWLPEPGRARLGADASFASTTACGSAGPGDDRGPRRARATSRASGSQSVAAQRARSTRSSTSGSPTRRCGRSTTTRSAPRPSTASGGTPTVDGQPAVRRRGRRASRRPGGTVWVHDYQLQLVPQMLRELRPDLRIGFFLHIPFPPQRAVLAAAVATRDPRRAARRRPRGLPGAPAPRRTSRASRAGCSGARGHRLAARGRRARACASARSRSRSTATRSSSSRARPEVRARAARDPRGPRRPRARAARRRPARLHQGHPAAHPGASPSCFDDGSLERRAPRHGPGRGAEPRGRRPLRARAPRPRAGRRAR